MRLEMITPIRGRKQAIRVGHLILTTIRNDNPDKGTETIKSDISRKTGKRLEMITPIRGRKLTLMSHLSPR